MYQKFTFKKWEVGLLIQMNKGLYKKRPYFIVYLNVWFSKKIKIVFLYINDIALLFVLKNIIQLNILVDIMSP